MKTTSTMIPWSMEMSSTMRRSSHTRKRERVESRNKLLRVS